MRNQWVILTFVVVFAACNPQAGSDNDKSKESSEDKREKSKKREKNKTSDVVKTFKECSRNNADACLRACELGHPTACANLGDFYAKGTGPFKEDSVKAEEYRLKAHKLMIAECEGTRAVADTNWSAPFRCHMVGEHYKKGSFVPKNLEKAVYFFTKACDGNQEDACQLLGYLYWKGEGVVTQDFAKAHTYFERACNLKSDVGCTRLAAMFETGDGLPADREKAKKLYKKACDLGFKGSTACKKEVELEKPPVVVSCVAEGKPKPVTVAVALPNSEQTASVSLELPPGWTESTKLSFEPPKQVDEYFPTNFSLRAECQGNCDPEAIPKNMERGLTNLKKMAGQPNFNTGDPKLDAVRGKVEILEESDLEQGKLLALQVTYSQEVLRSGPYKQDFKIKCVWHQKGHPFFVELYGRGPLEMEQSCLAPMLSMCRSVKVLSPKKPE